MEDLEDHRSQASTGNVPGNSAPVSFELSKASTCCLCSCRSTDPSPLNEALELDAWGGRRPWSKYRKVKDPVTKDVFRVPEGKLCLICYNVFRSLGLQYQYASYSDYYKKAQGSSTDHGAFMAAVKEWIKAHNENPEQRLQSRDLLAKAKTSLASQHKVGVRFKKPKMLFVLEKNWDIKVHGEFDASKVVEQMAFGKLERGIYVQAGQQGVFEVEHYDDMGVMEETEEHGKDEQGPLAAVGLQNKRKAVHSMVHEAAAERAAKSTKPAAPMEFDAILSVLQSTGHLSSSAGAASSSKADDPAAKAGAAPAGSESFDSTDSEEDNPAARLSAAVKGKAAGKPAPKKAAAKPAPAPSGKQARLDKPAVPGKKEHKAGAEGASPPDSSAAAPEPPVGTLSLDGRGQRLQESLKKHIEEVEEDLESRVRFLEDCEGGGKDVKKIQLVRHKLLGSLLTTLRSQTKRVDDSANKAGLAAEYKMLTALTEEVTSLSSLGLLLQQPNPDAEELTRGLRKAETVLPGGSLGKGAWLKAVAALAAHHAMYRAWDKVASLYNEEQEQAGRDPVLVMPLRMIFKCKSDTIGLCNTSCCHRCMTLAPLLSVQEVALVAASG